MLFYNELGEIDYVLLSVRAKTSYICFLFRELTERVEKMEARLKEDVLQEAQCYDSAIILNREIEEVSVSVTFSMSFRLPNIFSLDFSVKALNI